MVVSVPVTSVTAESIFVDSKGKHVIESVRNVRGQIALLIDGFWNYFHTAAKVNVIG